jgi:hypothetical protein
MATTDHYQAMLARNSSRNGVRSRFTRPHRAAETEPDALGSDAPRLLESFDRLARARDEAEVLSALAHGVGHLGPAALTLEYVYTDANGTIYATQLARVWTQGEPVGEHQRHGLRLPAGSHRRVAVSSTELRVVEDVAQDLELAAHTRTLGLPTRSFVGLPLYSERHGAHQSAVGLHWSARFTPRASDVQYLLALAPIAAEMIAGARTIRAHRDTLAIQQALLAHTEWALREAGKRQRMLQAVLERLPIEAPDRSADSEVVCDAVAALQLEAGTVPPEVSLKVFRETSERAFIAKRLGDHGWNVSRAAEALGIERTHLHKKIKMLGIDRPGVVLGG